MTSPPQLDAPDKPGHDDGENASFDRLGMRKSWKGDPDVYSHGRKTLIPSLSKDEDAFLIPPGVPAP